MHVQAEPGRQCPAPDVLDAFVQGGLAAPEVEAVEHHLDGCSECGRVVAELAWVYGAGSGDLSASSEPVLLEGETGTGKELLAECLHEQGSRAQAPFVVLDCTGASDIDVNLRCIMAVSTCVRFL